MRVFTKFAAAAATATLLSSGSALAQTEIQWWHAMGGALGEKVNEIAAGFNATQDDYTVIPVYKGNYTETMTSAIAAFRADEQPHIVQVFEVGTATMMAAEGAVYPVHQIMTDHDIAFDIGAYLPAVVSYYTTTEGDLLSLPFNSSTPVLWYNKDAFKLAGIDAPPKTWEEMGQASKKLQAAGLACGFSLGWQSWVLVENMSAWHNAPIGTMENGFAGLGTEFKFQENGVVPRLVAQLGEWQKDKIFDYGGRRGESLPKFTNGECGMWINSSAYYASIKEQASFEFGQALLPHFADDKDAPQNSIIGGATLWVLRGHDGDDYKGVAQFFKYMSLPEVQADWHQSTGYVPITTAAWELSKEQGFYKENPGTDTAIKQLSLNAPTPNSKGLRFGNFVQIRDIINEELEAVWSGDKSAQEALNDAAERGNALLRKFEDANS
ncbi:MAG: sn-glycerol-3-phosphate ABC transporter substrate-binding protein UgpB [Rhodovibrionaceae bacterium]|nr:sn-glycerol-3-phosphate ABC transporter substrate-binding protein UgpB [Rhodovibrionaceae bacterium]